MSKLIGKKMIASLYYFFIFCLALHIHVYYDYQQSTSYNVLLDFSLAVKAETLIFISGCGSVISSAKEGKSGFIYNLVKS